MSDKDLGGVAMPKGFRRIGCRQTGPARGPWRNCHFDMSDSLGPHTVQVLVVGCLRGCEVEVEAVHLLRHIKVTMDLSARELRVRGCLKVGCFI
jgi:hypothetical protein